MLEFGIVRVWNMIDRVFGGIEVFWRVERVFEFRFVVLCYVCYFGYVFKCGKIYFRVVVVFVLISW